MQSVVDDVDEIERLVASVLMHGEERAAEQLYGKLGSYGERPQLLDKHFKRLLDPVVAALDPVADKHVLQERAARVFYFFCKLRGSSIVAKVLPHEPHHLHAVYSLLSSREWCWEGLYVWFVWLGELVLVPLALSRLLPLQDELQSLLSFSKKHLCSLAKPSEAARAMLARLLKRTDAATELVPFVEWCVLSISGASEDDIPLYAMLSALLAVGERSRLLPLASVFQQVPLPKEGGTSSALRRKSALKFVARLGLLYLAPRLAPWRYQRGKRILLADASSQIKEDQDAEVEETEKGPQETWRVPRQVDKVAHLLLEGLRDQNTIVRWTAAKGIGELAMRLPAEFAKELCDAVLEIMGPLEEECAWHGACLATAELCRRGLLLPAQFGVALPALVAALRYDVRQGTRSAGSQVRDAACYVMWAVARAYSKGALAKYSHLIAGTLLEVCCLDREVNVRRAASAALQEHVGRVGLVPHGIELVVLADYFRLGSLRSAFFEVALQVCSYPEYGPWMVETLIERKISHWDTQVRDFAAQIVGEACFRHEFCRQVALKLLPKVREACADPVSAETRHGAILAFAFSCKWVSLPQDTLLHVSTIVPELELARLFRGKGGEMVRLAACTLTRCLAEARVPLVLNLDRLKPHLKGRPDSGKTSVKRHKEFLDECLRTPSEELQLEASRALNVFCTTYLSGLAPTVRAAVVSSYVGLLKVNPNEPQPVSHSRGAALALGALPMEMFANAESSSACHEALCEAAIANPDAETRKFAVESLRPQLGSISRPIAAALCDYAADERGDVGSWIREAACKKLAKESVIWNSAKEVERATAGVLQNLVGRMDNLRPPALSALQQLISSNCPHAAELSATIDLVSHHDGSVWLLYVRLLELDAFRQDVFASLCVTCGVRCPDISARNALLSFLSSSTAKNVVLLQSLWTDMLALLKCSDERVLAHYLFTFDLMVRNGCFDGVPVNSVLLRETCLAATVRSTVVSTLCVGIDLIAAILRFSPENQKDFEPIVQFLGHPFPRVRQHAALQLQLELASRGDQNLSAALIAACSAEDVRETQIRKLLGLKIVEAQVTQADNNEDEI